MEVHLPKTKAEKQAELAELTDALRQAQVVILTEYRGLTVGDINKIRGQLRAKGTTFSVAKNTLTSLALKAEGLAAPEDLLKGPTALAFVRDDIPGSTRLLNQFVRETRILTVKGAILGQSVLKGDQVDQLQDMPTKDMSRAAIAGAVVGPLTQLVGVLNAPLREIAYVIQQRADQLGAPAAEAN
jgi:large subunit ribosomal protein L10